jgi:lipid A ethanolaminephosphotransferase
MNINLFFLVSSWRQRLTYFKHIHWQTSSTKFVLWLTILNIGLYNLPVILFAVANLDYLSLNGILTITTILVVIFIFTYTFLTLFSVVHPYITKLFCILVALSNSLALYFVFTYQIVLDVTMISNILNTNITEASSYFHPKLILYFLILGIIPAWLILKTHIYPVNRKGLLLHALIIFFLSISWIYLNASTWLWIDKNSKHLGSRIMPWSYIGNLVQNQTAHLQGQTEQKMLPPAIFTDNEKKVVVLVIGEAARAQNFSLYRYSRITNPLLAKIKGVVALQNATSCSTYTTASLRCILSHTDVSSAFSQEYETLPTYLHRHGVDVIWRSNNWGEPEIKTNSYQRAGELEKKCKGEGCKQDEVLLTGLKERIAQSKYSKVLVILHQYGSHGPSYNTGYPPRFEVFKPACSSVELNQCTNQELFNAYDNTILYTDYFLARTIKMLQTLNSVATLMYISDHGESLGEYGLYLHGAPFTIAPDVQKNIPFLVWMAPKFISAQGIIMQQRENHSQQNIFHSVMGAMNMRSDIYNEQLDIFSVMTKNIKLLNKKNSK